MAETSLFFDSVDGDRRYTAGDFAALFDGLIGVPGVSAKKLNALRPTNDNTLSIKLDTGVAYHDGYMYRNSSLQTLALDAVTSGQKRIDRLVIRFDPITQRRAFAVIVKGVETAGTPSAPAVAATDEKIAQILVDRSSGSYVYLVTDERTFIEMSQSSPSLYVGQEVNLPKRVATPSAAKPLIDRSVWNDIDSANAPLLFSELSGEVLSFGGVSTVAANVSGQRITFSSQVAGSAGAKILGALAKWGSAVGFLNQNQNANFTADFSTAATQKVVRINGVCFAITAVSTVGWYIDAAGTLPQGAVTIDFPTYLIAGQPTKIRLPKRSGFFSAPAGDYDGDISADWLGMDQFMGHRH